METFDSFEKCCQAKGYDPENCLPDVSKLPEQFQRAILSLSKLMIITEAVNEGWVPDWNNRSEKKWIPWFDMEVDGNNPGGCRFDGSFYGTVGSYSAGGSLLCYVSEEVCEFVAKHYQDLWQAAMK